MCDRIGKVLLVDDDIYHLKSMKYYLEKKFRNAFFDTETNIGSAINILKKAEKDGVPYHAVVCDWDFGDDIYGSALLSEMKKEGISADFRIMSGFILNSGIWIKKPVDLYSFYKYLITIFEKIEPVPQFGLIENVWRAKNTVDNVCDIAKQIVGEMNESRLYSP